MKIQICTGKTCSDRFSEYIITRLKNDKERFNVNTVEIEETLCMGKCKDGPNIKIENEAFIRMNPLKTSELLFKKIKENNVNKKHKK